LLAVTTVILALEIRFLHTSVLELSAASFGGRNVPIELGRWRFPLFGLVFLWSAVMVVLPITVLIVTERFCGRIFSDKRQHFAECCFCCNWRDFIDLPWLLLRISDS
jgi:hypothetical protein